MIVMFQRDPARCHNVSKPDSPVQEQADRGFISSIDDRAGAAADPRHFESEPNRWESFGVDRLERPVADPR